MEIIYHCLYKIDIAANNVSLQHFAESINVNKYILDLLQNVSDNEGDREYKFEEGSITMNSYLNHIINNNDRDKISSAIATRLLQEEIKAQEKIEHLDVQIQKGILIISFVQMTETEKKVIISKADYNEFIEEVSGNIKNGLPTKKKIFKAFIANVSSLDGVDQITKLVTYDSNTTKAAYWTKEFLELQEIRNDEKNTSTAYSAIKRDILEPLRKKNKSDYLCLWNATVAYFRGEGEFNLDYYRDRIIGNYQPMDTSLNMVDIKDKIEKLPSKYKFDKLFTKKPNIVTARFKNTITLTDEIDLIIKHDVPNPKVTFKKYIDEEGKKYIAIRSDEGYLYAHYIENNE